MSRQLRKICDFGTSLFSGRADSQKREINKLIKLAELIFHDFRVSDFIELDLRTLSPFQVLRILDYWVVVISAIKDKKLDDIGKERVYDIIFSMVQAPFFKFDLLMRIEQFRKHMGTCINQLHFLINVVQSPPIRDPLTGREMRSGKGYFSTFREAKARYMEWRDKYLKLEINVLGNI